MYPSAYIQFLVHFHGDRDYFECHEILEEYWKERTDEDKKSVWVGLILVAVSNYHYRRGNTNGAMRTLKKAISIFQNQKTAALGVDIDSLLKLLSERVLHIQSGTPYSSFNLPILDLDLLKKCQKICFDKGYEWGNENDMEKNELVNRHLLRDRSDAFRERENAIAKRKSNKDRE